MFASTLSAAQIGVDARPVHVESHVASGTGGFGIVGLPDAAVREARHRVKSAFTTSGYRFPSGHITVNLAPAALPKSGPAFDLPIALGILVAARLAPRATSEVVSVGELALDGSVRAARSVLAAARVAKRLARPLLVPAGAEADALLVEGVDVRTVRSLSEAVAASNGGNAHRPSGSPSKGDDVPGPDLVDVKGQPVARRALEIAAAGGHHLLLVGPPGAGKSMLARRLPSLFPPMSRSERLEVAAVWAASSRHSRPDGRPFRAPHHSASAAALLGGGSGLPEPGEVSLASNGVLFLDELGEFPAHVLDGLRQPLEDGAVTIARRGATVRYPATGQVVAATNPCPCGYRNDRIKPCVCSDAEVRRYRRKLSGPLLDRFDLSVSMDRPESFEGGGEETSRIVRGRVVAARDFARRRRGADRWCPEAAASLGRALADGVVTGRGHDRVRRVARTIADLDAAMEVTMNHLLEAMSLRVS